MKIARILLPMLGALALVACGSTKTAGTASAPQHCFNAASVSNYAGVDRETVNLRVGVSDYYQVKMLGVCPNIDWTQKIGLESTSGSNICTGLDLTIHVPGPTGPQECAADSIRKLTPEEVAALPKGQKP
ncbi:hypothetical protein sos41_16960 [Alphaproteobacteria bacterium SO-S41]|nr:hypothetical protein sos41_16960 [Alphaproteobacteria bacterium SO-S41]